eukprot:c26884_g1_i2 orf=665-1168(+)
MATSRSFKNGRERISISEVEAVGKNRNPNLCNPVPGSGPLTLVEVLLALQETQEQRECRIVNLFNFFDSSRSGYVDHSQIVEAFQAFSIPSQYKYAKDLLDVCDANHDGRMDYGEFRKYMDDKELELYRIFREIDVKHNGCIVPEELGDALLRAGFPAFLYHCISKT